MGIFHVTFDKMETDLSTIKNNLGTNLAEFGTMMAGHPSFTDLPYSKCFTDGQLSFQELENKVPSLDKCIKKAELNAFSTNHITSSQEIGHDLSDGVGKCMGLFLAFDDCFGDMFSNINERIETTTTNADVNKNWLLDDFQACTLSIHDKLSGELEIAKTVFSNCVEV